MPRSDAFTAQLPIETETPIVAIDLGYSARRSSCGVAWTGGAEAFELAFGEAIIRSRDLLQTFHWKAILVLEAVLSTYHQDNGNPDIRGDFESGRGWYYGAGVLSFAAALRFLGVLSASCPEAGKLPLAEAFLSNKYTSTRHADDALTIRDNFWQTTPIILRQGVEPASLLIDGVPTVRVF